MSKVTNQQADVHTYCILYSYKNPNQTPKRRTYLTPRPFLFSHDPISSGLITLTLTLNPFSPSPSPLSSPSPTPPFSHHHHPTE